MPAFQLLRCKIALAGDREQVVHRHRDNPILYPELLVLQFIHGDDAITDLATVGVWNTTYTNVMDRLCALYGDEAVKEVYPGARPQLPLQDPTIAICTKPVYVAKPTLPDRPDPIITPLDQFTFGDKNAVKVEHDAPRTADPVTPYEQSPVEPVEEEAEPEQPLTEDELDAEMAREFSGGADFIRSETQDEVLNRTIREGLDAERKIHDEKMAKRAAAQGVKADAGSIRPQQDKVRGRLASSPRTRDHLPDVAGGNRRELAERQMRAAAGESRVTGT